MSHSTGCKIGLELRVRFGGFGALSRLAVRRSEFDGFLLQFRKIPSTCRLESKASRLRSRALKGSSKRQNAANSVVR